jgi:multidrug resistance efflux pump
VRVRWSRRLCRQARTSKAVRARDRQRLDRRESTTYSAIITPNAQVDLAFRVSGYVVDICRTKGADGRLRAVERGAAVTTGLVLARLRATDYQAMVDKAQGSRDESGAAVHAAEAALAEAQAALTQAESDFNRIAALWQQESVTKPPFDASKARLDAAKAKVDAAAASIAAANQRTSAAAAQLRKRESHSATPNCAHRSLPFSSNVTSMLERSPPPARRHLPSRT